LGAQGHFAWGHGEGGMETAWRVCIRVIRAEALPKPDAIVVVRTCPELRCYTTFPRLTVLELRSAMAARIYRKRPPRPTDRRASRRQQGQALAVLRIGRRLSFFLLSSEQGKIERSRCT